MLNRRGKYEFWCTDGGRLGDRDVEGGAELPVAALILRLKLSVDGDLPGSIEPRRSLMKSLTTDSDERLRGRPFSKFSLSASSATSLARSSDIDLRPFVENRRCRSDNFFSGWGSCCGGCSAATGIGAGLTLLEALW